MAGNGRSSQVDDGIDFFRSGIEEARLRIPERLRQVAKGYSFAFPDFRSGAKQSSYLVTLMTEAINDGRSDEAR